MLFNFLNEIKTQIDSLKAKKFTGYIRIGIEAGTIVSVSFRGNPEDTNRKIIDIEKEIQKVSPEEKAFFGYIIYYMDNGELYSTDYSLNYQGVRAREFMHRCRNA